MAPSESDNAASQNPYTQEILNNILREPEEKYVFNQDKVPRLQTPTPPEVCLPGKLVNAHTHQENKAFHRKRRQRRLMKVCGYLGWIFFCPAFAVVQMIREPPVDDADIRDDPCVPWSYSTHPHDSLRRSSV